MKVSVGRLSLYVNVLPSMKRLNEATLERHLTNESTEKMKTENTSQPSFRSSILRTDN